MHKIQGGQSSPKVFPTIENPGWAMLTRIIASVNTCPPCLLGAGAHGYNLSFHVQYQRGTQPKINPLSSLLDSHIFRGL